jgi:hypothetical protein
MMKIENRAFTLGELQIIAVANEETDYFEAELRKLIAAWRTMSLLECTQAESE